MSKRETPFTRRYWQEVGGTLIEEFPAVRRGKHRGPRLLDGVIVPDDAFEIRNYKDVEIADRDIIVVQTKDMRLGMYLMGQAFFSAKLMEAFWPASIRTVAVCTRYDEIMEPLARAHGIEVIVYDDISAEELRNEQELNGLYRK